MLDSKDDKVTDASKLQNKAEKLNIPYQRTIHPTKEETTSTALGKA